jgi:lysophospholipase L1-like esterase
MNRTLVGALAAASIVTASLIAAAPAFASPPAKSQHAYVVLGDSLAVGVGASDPSLGYVPQVADFLAPNAPGHRVTLQSFAVSGDESGDLVAGQLPGALALINQRTGNHKFADDVAAITVDIGGNDVAGLIPVCSGGLTPACQAQIGTTLGTFAFNLNVTLAQLRAAAGPDTPIVVMTLYNSLANPGCPVNYLAGAADLVLEGGGPIPAGINDIIRVTAAAYDVRVAETYAIIGPTDVRPDCLHANDVGHAKVAQAFEAVLAD